jgi:hypothetical protein
VRVRDTRLKRSAHIGAQLRTAAPACLEFVCSLRLLVLSHVLLRLNVCSLVSLARFVFVCTLVKLSTVEPKGRANSVFAHLIIDSMY